MSPTTRIVYHPELGPLEDIHPEVMEWIGVKIIELQAFPNLGSIEHADWLIVVEQAPDGSCLARYS
jgi:hypothetical protein